MYAPSTEALRLSGDVGATIDVVSTAGDVGGVFAGEPDDQSSDVVSGALSPQRNSSRQTRFVLFIGSAGADVGSHNTWRDGIHRYAVYRHLPGEGASEADWIEWEQRKHERLLVA